MNKKIIFAISKMNGGGAEHVIIQLADYMLEQGYDVEILVTSQTSSSIDRVGLHEDINIFCLNDHISCKKISCLQRINSLVCRCFEKFNKAVPDKFAYQSFKGVYGGHVELAKQYLSQRKDAVVIAFLQPANEILMMACKETGNKIIVSERADPWRFFKTRYAPFFLKNYYPYLNWAVFQTIDAKHAYPMCVQEKSDIILNPIPNTLPDRFSGERQKKVVNFCRFSHQKNIPLLVDAFDIFYESHRDYTLELYGDGELKDEIAAYIKTKQCSSAVSVFPHKQHLHESIKNYMMFVSSSDYEGMSNSMLEAMAIGLPTICTDCPIGGARTVIEDGVNGLLVPIKDKQALADAMCKVADDLNYANELSMNAQKIRYEQSIEVIGRKWRECIEKIQ